MGATQRRGAGSHHHAAPFQRRDLIEVDQLVVEGDDVHGFGERVEGGLVGGVAEHDAVARGDGCIVGRRREHGDADVKSACFLAHHPSQLPSPDDADSSTAKLGAIRHDQTLQVVQGGWGHAHRNRTGR